MEVEVGEEGGSEEEELVLGRRDWLKGGWWSFLDVKIGGILMKGGMLDSMDHCCCS